MSTIAHNGNIGGNLTRNASLRVAICAGLALALTTLTMQVIGGATGISQSAQVQSARVQSVTAIEAAAPLPTVTVVAAR